MSDPPKKSVDVCNRKLVLSYDQLFEDNPLVTRVWWHSEPEKIGFHHKNVAE